jgi:hypothetical protein
VSSFDQARSRLGKRVKRDGEWGGDGYTSLRGSKAGSEAHHAIHADGEAEEERRDSVEGGGVVVTAHPSELDPPPTPPKPTYYGWKSVKPSPTGKEEKGMGCLGDPSGGILQIMLPPSCIAVGTGYIDNNEKQGGLLLPVSGAAITGSSEAERRSRTSRVVSYVSTGQVSSRSRRRLVIWLGVACLVGLGVVGGTLAGILEARKT